MKKQSQQKFKKCVGILQIIVAFFMIAHVMIARGGGLIAIAFVINRLIHKGADSCITWMGESLFTFIYCILTTIIGGILMFLGEKLTGSYIITEESDEAMQKDRSLTKELLIAVLNILFILLSVSDLIVRPYNTFGLRVFLLCSLPLIPSVVLAILAFILLRIKRKERAGEVL